MAVNLRASHYRFGVNELAESTHGWHAAEDANPAQGVIANDTTFLLRFTEQETGGTAAGNTDAQLQCRKNGGAWQDVTTSSTIVKAVTTTVFANGADLTKRLSGTGTFESSGDGGSHDGLSGGAQNDIAASGNSETEYALQIVGADVAGGDVIEFRLTSPDWTITNDVVPSLTVEQGAVTGTMAATEGADAAALVGDVIATASMAPTEGSDTATLAGDVVATGTLAPTEAADTFAASGTVADPAITGTLAATEAQDAFAGEADLIAAATLAATEATDGASLGGDVIAGATLQATESGDAMAALMDAAVSAALSITEPGDTFAGSGTVASAGASTGTLAATDAPDTASAIGDVLLGMALAALEASDVAALVGSALVAPPMLDPTSPPASYVYAMTRQLTPPPTHWRIR